MAYVSFWSALAYLGEISTFGNSPIGSIILERQFMYPRLIPRAQRLYLLFAPYI
jgi:hypothetical protein